MEISSIKIINCSWPALRCGGLALLMLITALSTGCNPPSERETKLSELLRNGTFARKGTTTVAGDQLEFWHQQRDKHFGPFVIVARDRNARLLDYCQGEFRSSSRPYYQSGRYAALVAGEIGGSLSSVFVYDSEMDAFDIRQAPVDHVHEGFVIIGARALLSTCKAREPVWLLDLETGKVASLGCQAPQGATFHFDGDTVLVSGAREVYELAGETLSPCHPKRATGTSAGQSFDQVRLASGSNP